jgi:hypothetical protein
MDDVAFDHLERAVELYGPVLFQDRQESLSSGSQTTRNVLRDLCGDRCGPDKHGPEISALVQAVVVEIPDKLLSRGEALPPTLGDQLAAKLTNLGIGEALARWAVRSWARVLQVGPLRISAPGIGLSGLGSAQAEASAARLADLAARTAASLSAAEGRAAALATAAAGLAASDADRSAGLVREAERLLAGVTRQDRKALEQHAVAVALAIAYPRQAELAVSIEGSLRDHALARIAAGLVGVDSDRAMRLAEQIADQSVRMHTICGLLTVVAGGDPHRAVGLARLQTGGYWLAETLCNLAAVDTTRAAELIDEAETIARSIGDDAVSAAALAGAARALHSVDGARAAVLFDQAEALARSAADPSALGSLAIALAAADLDRALGIASALPDPWYASGEIAKVIAPRQPARAMRLAQSITPHTLQLADVAIVLADAAPEAALILARSISNARCRATAMVGIARNLAGVDPDRAARLLDDEEEIAVQLPDDLDKVAVLADIATAWASVW